jgi:hypothetical protein
VELPHDAKTTTFLLERHLEVELVSLGVDPGEVLPATGASGAKPEHEKDDDQNEEESGCPG